MKNTQIRVTPSVSSPNLTAIQADIESVLRELNKKLYDETLMNDCYRKAIREYSDKMGEHQYYRYIGCIERSDKLIGILKKEIQKHEQYFATFLIERI